MTLNLTTIRFGTDRLHFVSVHYMICTHVVYVGRARYVFGVIPFNHGYLTKSYKFNYLHRLMCGECGVNLITMPSLVLLF